MSILGKIFGTDKVISKGLGLIDKLWDSGEEKTAQKVELLKAYAPFKLAQRVIAFSFVGVYLPCFAWAVWMAYTPGWSSQPLTEVMEEFKIGYITLIIVTFYFGAGATEGVIKTLLKKK